MNNLDELIKKSKDGTDGNRQIANVQYRLRNFRNWNKPDKGNSQVPPDNSRA